jgi:prepilin-type N-terminal cleavage/methylation domain-containing protein
MAGHGLQQGFSAVELLITLFVAAAFLVTGYQLYYSVIERSGQARLRSIATNVAYDNLRFYAAKVTAPCTSTSNPTPTPTIPANSGLGDASITVSLTCPFGTSNNITTVTVQVGYGPASDKEFTEHKIYATPSL